ncbi:MAG: hypothetical protein ABI779_27615 [Acidobacteriota bacterium]
MLSPAEEIPPTPAGPRPAPGPFSHTEYFFSTGLRSGETAPVRSASGEVLLTYRSFAGVIGVVAALVAGIVAVAGLAATLLLFTQPAPLSASVALLLTIAFTVFIALLAPRTQVTLFDGGQPALTIAQRTLFPAATYIIAAPNGARLADVRKSPLSRLGRNRWTILHEGRYLGEAVESSLLGALVRKLYGKFSRSFQTDVIVTHGGVEAARILRRPDRAGRVDLLEIFNDTLDRRVLVGVATLILGREP